MNLPGRGSLRLRLILAGGLVQLVAAALLLAGGLRVLDGMLAAQVSDQVRQVATLLDQAIAPGLAQRDWATLQQTLDLVRNDDPVRYLVLHDHRGRPVVASGRPLEAPLPARDHADRLADLLVREDATLHLSVPVVMAGQPLGRLDLGLCTLRQREARADFMRRSLAIAAIGLALSMGLFAAIAFAVTRHLARLARASQRVAAGDLHTQVRVASNDEIGRLAACFNLMAATLRQRVAALEASEQRQHELLDATREQHARLTLLLSSIRSGILFVDGQGGILYANASFLQLWALDEEELAGQPLATLLPRLRDRLLPGEAGRLEVSPDACGCTALHPELHTLDGRVIAQRVQRVSAEDASRGFLWFLDDVTLERQARQHAWEALHDPLTRLLNRRGMDHALARARAERDEGGAPLTLMFIDLDDFKRANDLGGHRTGDDILVAVARTLTTLAAAMPCGAARFVAARMGGDEFAVLCRGVGPDEAAGLAQRVIDAVARLRFTAGAHTLQVGCSIGIAGGPQDAGDDAEALVARADAAMYRAKQRGKNRWACHPADPVEAG